MAVRVRVRLLPLPLLLLLLGRTEERSGREKKVRFVVVGGGSGVRGW